MYVSVICATFASCCASLYNKRHLTWAWYAAQGQGGLPEQRQYGGFHGFQTDSGSSVDENLRTRTDNANPAVT